MTKYRKQLVLLGCGDDRYRTYLLAQVSEVYDVWLINDTAPTWQAPYIAGSTVVADFRQSTIEQAIDAQKGKTDIAGIVCWDERYITVAADCSAFFGLPSAGSIGIRGCRDKALNRKQLKRAGILQPLGGYCAKANEAVRLAEMIGYPIVVKPRGMGGSIGVSLATSENDLRTRFAAADSASLTGAAEFQCGAIVEEYITGDEISIDGMIVEGFYTPMFVARKTVGLAPYFEEISHVVSINDPLLQDADLMAMVADAHKAIHFENGITHTEVKLAEAGPTIIEINGRLGGDLIPYLASLAFGFKPGLIAGQIAAGDMPDLKPAGGSIHAAISFQYPERNMVVEDVHLPEPLTLPDVVGRPVALGRPGEQVGLPPAYHHGRIGYALAIGSDRDACIHISHQLAKQIFATAHI